MCGFTTLPPDSRGCRSLEMLSFNTAPGKRRLQSQKKSVFITERTKNLSRWFSISLCECICRITTAFDPSNTMNRFHTLEFSWEGNVFFQGYILRIVRRNRPTIQRRKVDNQIQGSNFPCQFYNISRMTIPPWIHTLAAIPSAALANCAIRLCLKHFQFSRQKLESELVRKAIPMSPPCW